MDQGLQSFHLVLRVLSHIELRLKVVVLGLPESLPNVHPARHLGHLILLCVFSSLMITVFLMNFDSAGFLRHGQRIQVEMLDHFFLICGFKILFSDNHFIPLARILVELCRVDSFVFRGLNNLEFLTLQHLRTLLSFELLLGE